MPDINLIQSQSWPNITKTLLKDLGDDEESHALTVANILVGIVDGVPVLLEVDDITNALVTIDTVHREIHEGETFQASYKSPDGSEIADNANVTILIRTSTKTLHLTVNAAAGGDAELEYFENVVVSDTNVALTFFNMDRTSSGIILPLTSIFIDPTIGNLGTRIHNSLIPGGTQPRTGGGVAREETEWPLKKQTNYAVRLINRAGQAQPLSLTVQGYEED